jgi:hypothetical protein
VSTSIEKRAKRLLASYLIAAVIVAVILALRLLNMGRPPSEVLKSMLVLLVLISIPILGSYRAVKLKETDQRPESQKRKLFVIRVMVLFVLAPLLAALMYYITYPSISLGMPLAVAVIAAASLFYFFVR